MRSYNLTVITVSVDQENISYWNLMAGLEATGAQAESGISQSYRPALSTSQAPGKPGVYKEALSQNKNNKIGKLKQIINHKCP